VGGRGTGAKAAEELLAEGSLEKAEGVLVEQLSRNPRDIASYELLSRVYVEKKDFAQAKEVLEEALRRSPSNPALYGLLGRVYVGLGEYGYALQLYQRAHDADERNLDYLEQLLLIATRMDRRPLVKVTAEKILALDANHAEAKKHLARIVVTP